MRELWSRGNIRGKSIAISSTLPLLLAGPFNPFFLVVFLSTLAKMGFPTIWITWIQTCISSPSSSFIINGQPSNYFTDSRGIRQGDPLLSYLFILVSQNLTTIFNDALSLDIIPGFNHRLTHNFNHIMYADDFILVTKASRSMAHNINTCLSINFNLIRQKSNNSKSIVYFPDGFDRRFSRSISTILDFKISNFSLTYLGISISPRKLHLTIF